MKDGDELFLQREVEKARDQEVNDVEHLHPPVPDGRHGATVGASPPPGLHRLPPSGETEGVDLGVGSMHPPPRVEVTQTRSRQGSTWANSSTRPAIWAI